MEIGYNKVTKQKGTSVKRLTVPGMSVNMAKALQYVRQHPINDALMTFSSKNPEVLNAIDLTMMSKLDRLRYVNALRDKNSKLSNAIKTDAKLKTTFEEKLKLKELHKIAKEEGIKEEKAKSQQVSK